MNSCWIRDSLSASVLRRGVFSAAQSTLVTARKLVQTRHETQSAILGIETRARRRAEAIYCGRNRAEAEVSFAVESASQRVPLRMHTDTRGYWADCDGWEL